MRTVVSDTIYGAIAIVLCMSTITYYGLNVTDQQETGAISVVVEDVPLVISAGI